MENKKHAIKKIGFYDSGLGGLFVMSEVHKKFPNYEYVFLGDEKNLPYGTKNIEELFGYARTCLNFLFTKENCDIVVIACNTLSATVYESLQKEYQEKYPNKLLLDIISPTIDSLKEDAVYSVFGTTRTIESHVYSKRIKDSFKKSHVIESATVKLAELIEKGNDVTEYISTFKTNELLNRHTCILACTHYGLVRDVFSRVFPNATHIISQETIMCDFLSFFLHTDVHIQGGVTLYVTKENNLCDQYARSWFPEISVGTVSLD